MMLLRLFVNTRLRKINDDALNKGHDYGVPFSEQQYMPGLVIYLFLNANPLISLIPPNGLKF